MQIEEIQEEIVSEFSMFDDWMQRYEYMIELGKSLPKIEEQYKTDEHLIKGCQSKVWVHADLEEGNVVFTADSDAIIILAAGTDFIDEIGLKEHLSPTRANGLVSMIKQLKMYALAYEAQMES